jgi:hypothetical protein
MNTDTLVHVRTHYVSYPSWVKGSIFPQYEFAGLKTYDLGDLTSWFHPDQLSETRVVRGESIYAQLREQGLSCCLGLADGDAITKKPPGVFNRFFTRKVVPLWRSTCMSRQDGSLWVPCMSEDSLATTRASWTPYWVPVSFGFGARSPAFQFCVH